MSIDCKDLNFAVGHASSSPWSTLRNVRFGKAPIQAGSCAIPVSVMQMLCNQNTTVVTIFQGCYKVGWHCRKHSHGSPASTLSILLCSSYTNAKMCTEPVHVLGYAMHMWTIKATKCVHHQHTMAVALSHVVVSHTHP